MLMPTQTRTRVVEKSIFLNFQQKFHFIYVHFRFVHSQITCHVKYVCIAFAKNNESSASPNCRKAYSVEGLGLGLFVNISRIIRAPPLWNFKLADKSDSRPPHLHTQALQVDNTHT